MSKTINTDDIRGIFGVPFHAAVLIGKLLSGDAKGESYGVLAREVATHCKHIEGVHDAFLIAEEKELIEFSTEGFLVRFTESAVVKIRAFFALV